MANGIIARRLWYQDQDAQVHLDQTDLHFRTGPIVVLGEAGMGKSRLLEWLAEADGYALCTARKLINRHDPNTLLGDASVLVIDALDEVSVRKEGDAVDLVLQKLGELGYPRFILSCRVADWRSATGLESIREQYDDEPLELHLEPFTDDDIAHFLTNHLGSELAASVTNHFKRKGLEGLLGNPQTLELIAEVAQTGSLPETQSELFDRAIDKLWGEHRDAKAVDQPAREVVLGAAGAAFAALILTGSEVIVRKSATNVGEGELLLADVARLQGAEGIEHSLGSRLFKAEGADRFTYWHRRIGEFLGACWLVKQADTKRKRRRLLSMFQSRGLVPASLRGIHAWLLRDPSLTSDVIAADPMGVIEYGDADELTVEQARTLLNSLEKLAVDNPRFREWRDYSVRGILQPELIGDIRRLITAADTPLGLKTLVLDALKGAPLATEFVDDLHRIVLDRNEAFACRYDAGEALADVGGSEDWPETIQTVQGYGDEDSIRLAIDLIDKVGYDLFGDELIVDLVVAECRNNSRLVGVFFGLERHIPDSRLAGVLDCLAEAANELGEPSRRPGSYELTDFTRYLIARCIEIGDIDIQRLWSWLEPFDVTMGYDQELRQRIDHLIRNDDLLRRSIQHHVLLERDGGRDVREGAWQLQRSAMALMPSPEDDVELLQSLDPADTNDERWRELLHLIQHDGEIGAEVRDAARVFAEHDEELLDWLDRLSTPSVPEWQIRHEEWEREQREEHERELSRVREHYVSNMGNMRAGQANLLWGLAEAYLKLRFHDGRDDEPAHKRIEVWLGEDIAKAAYQGFESFLTHSPTPEPSAAEISASIVDGRHWHSGYVIVAALAERIRKGLGLNDLPDERLMAGLFELRSRGIENHSGIVGLTAALETTIRTRGVWPDAMRLYFEPRLQAGCEHVSDLSAFMNERSDAELATALGIEWLERFPDLPIGSESDLINRLVRSDRHEELLRLAATRETVEDEHRRRKWDAVRMICDFNRTVESINAVDPELLWYLRDLSDGPYHEGGIVTFNSQILEWIIGTFRALWTAVERPRSTSGNTCPWDATEYICRLIRRLGKDLSDESVAAVARLKVGPDDGYTDTIKVVAAEQARMRVESAYVPPTLEAIDAVTHDAVPVSIEDLQAYMIEELDIAQAKIRSDDVDSWRGFYNDNGVPFDEERCRDHLLTLLRQGSEHVILNPEAHVAGDNRVDITCSVRQLRIPIEIKGQWHSELWRAADTQLDRHYTQDWQADGRGIYLALWFGDRDELNKQLTSPGRGVERPQTPDELRQMLIDRSAAAQDGRVAIFVLDLALSEAG